VPVWPDSRPSGHVAAACNIKGLCFPSARPGFGRGLDLEARPRRVDSLGHRVQVDRSVSRWNFSRLGARSRAADRYRIEISEAAVYGIRPSTGNRNMALGARAPAGDASSLPAGSRSRSAIQRSTTMFRSLLFVTFFTAHVATAASTRSEDGGGSKEHESSFTQYTAEDAIQAFQTASSLRDPSGAPAQLPSGTEIDFLSDGEISVPQGTHVRNTWIAPVGETHTISCQLGFAEKGPSQVNLHSYSIILPRPCPPLSGQFVLVIWTDASGGNGGSFRATFNATVP
jgi:hypothetical protein